MKNIPTIGLVMKSLEAEFFKIMKSGALEYAAQNEQLNLITTGTNKQTDLEKQIDLVEDLIQKKVDALVLIPIDSKALVPVVIKAVQSGIHIVNIDIELDRTLLHKAGIELAFLGPDNKMGSEMAGNVLAKKLGPKAKVVLINGIPEADNAQKRREGFLASIEKNKLVLLGEGIGNWETDESKKAFTFLLQKYPDLDGVMCANDAMALGVIEVLESKGMTRVVDVVGFDNDPSSKKLIEEGKLLATIDAYGPQMAVEGIKQSLQALNGNENKAWIKSKISLITKDMQTRNEPSTKS